MKQRSDFLKGLGRRIAVLRKQKGLNQEEFADRTGKMINTISNIERGLSDPKVTTLLAIAGTLKIPVGHFFEGVPETMGDTVSTPVQRILHLVKDQDEKTLRVIEKQIIALLELK